MRPLYAFASLLLFSNPGGLFSQSTNAALSGRGSLVLIGGEPGIGKTHLARAILAEADRRGCFSAVGHCYEMEGSPPYVPFIEMLEYCARAVPRELFRHSIGPITCAPR